MREYIYLRFDFDICAAPCEKTQKIYNIVYTKGALEFSYPVYPPETMIYVRTMHPSSLHYGYLTPLNGPSLYHGGRRRGPHPPWSEITPRPYPKAR